MPVPSHSNHKSILITDQLSYLMMNTKIIPYKLETVAKQKQK